LDTLAISNRPPVKTGVAFAPCEDRSAICPEQCLSAAVDEAAAVEAHYYKKSFIENTVWVCGVGSSNKKLEIGADPGVRTKFGLSLLPVC
jgi:hypothetical protein